MKKIWDWVGSPTYCKLSAALLGVYVSIATLGITGDWMLAGAIALSFCFVWDFAKRAAEGEMK